MTGPLPVAAEAFRCELRLKRWPLEPGLDLPADGSKGELVRFLFRLVHEEPVEVFGAVFYDERSRPLGYTMPYRGRVSGVSPEIQHLLLKAWACRAESMVVFHNHPSGRPSPSQGDIDWTRRLLAHAMPLEIWVRDHVILGEEPRYCSLAATGAMRELGLAPGELYQQVRRTVRAAEAALASADKRRRRRRARPKYRDPDTGKTWAGRGSMAKWLVRRLEEGWSLEELRVPEDENDHAETPRLT